VLDLVTFTLNIESERSGLALDVTLQVVVVSQLELRVEEDFNW